MLHLVFSAPVNKLKAWALIALSSQDLSQRLIGKGPEAIKASSLRSVAACMHSLAYFEYLTSSQISIACICFHLLNPRWGRGDQAAGSAPDPVQGPRQGTRPAQEPVAGAAGWVWEGEEDIEPSAGPHQRYSQLGSNFAFDSRAAFDRGSRLYWNSRSLNIKDFLYGMFWVGQRLATWLY